MSQTLKLFYIGLKQTVSDGMLLMLLPAPFLLGAIVKWGVPFANALTERYLSFSFVPWYALIDAFLIALIPSMLSIINAFLLLDERDEGTGAYYQITPVQGYGYLIARLGLPSVWAFICVVIVGGVFGISGLSFGETILADLIGTGAGTACSLMIAALANNRVEGLAVSKLMGVTLLGVLAVWFIPAPYYYFASFLPSFWVGLIAKQNAAPFAVLGGVLSCALWIFIFVRKFLRHY